MSKSDGITLNWVNVIANQEYVISIDANGGTGICQDIEGTVYIDGDTPAGELTFGIKGDGGSFLAFTDGVFNTDKLLKHGNNVILMVSVAGISGKEFQIAYAGRVQ